MRFPQTWNAWNWKFAMFKNVIHSQLLKPLFMSPNRCETQITKNYQTSKYIYCSIISPFQYNYFYYRLVLILLNTKYRFFSDSGYVIKPPQPSSTICRALPFTLYRAPNSNKWVTLTLSFKLRGACGLIVRHHGYHYNGFRFDSHLGVGDFGFVFFLYFFSGLGFTFWGYG